MIEEQQRIDKVSQELQQDLEEMSKHKVYQKYAYMSV